MTFAHIAPKRRPDTAFEPALSQLRDLPPRELDQLVRSWLRGIDLDSLRRCEPTAGATTYHTLARSLPVLLGIRVRVHQRRSKLHVHHVESFAGHLVRAGVPAGILVTTGDCTSAARIAADSYRTPRVRLLSGEQWMAELARGKLGLRRRSFWHWVLDLPISVLNAKRHPSREDQ